MAAGLPSFRELVEKIYAELGEDWSLHAAEHEGMRENGALSGQYDRVLRCLERRLSGTNPIHNRRMRDRIRSAVRAALDVSTAGSLENHLALMELSRDEAGKTRLLTTNFDTLFERSWSEGRGGAIASHAGVGLPPPRGAGFSGVLHLHGRLSDPDAALNLSETDIVLTSAEFGDAYLRTGWASRYMYDLARSHTLVLIGYQAEDPPMRYLLEALEADRERFSDLRQVYAFAPAKDGDEELQEALWKAKGVKPILYPTAGHDHSALYNTLLEWWTYSLDPTAWRTQRLTVLLGEEPDSATDDEMTECVALLGHGDASEILGSIGPDAKWVKPLVERRVFRHGGAHFGSWAAAKINDPDMARACAPHGIADERGRWLLRRALSDQKQTIPSAIDQVWRLMLRQPNLGENELGQEWFYAVPLIKRGIADFEVRSTIAQIFRPRLRLGTPFRYELHEEGGDEAEDAEIRISDLIRVDFEGATYPSPSDVMKIWPSDFDQVRQLLNTLDRALLDSLEAASDVEFLSGWDRASSDVASVAEHPQNSHRSGFYPITRLVADLWDKLATLDSEAARGIALRWRRSQFELVQRLWLYALHNPIFDANFAADAVIELSDEIFWGSHSPVEMMRTLVGKWSDIRGEARECIEDRFRSGIPQSFYAIEIADDEEKWQSIQDSSVFRRLGRLQGSGCELTQDSVGTLEQIRGRHPEWAGGPGERDDFSHWMEVRSGPDGEAEKLANVSEERLVDEAMRLQREGNFHQGDIWRVFCAADPGRALRGLLSEAQANNWNSEAWRSLINAAMNVEAADFQDRLVNSVLAMPDATLVEILLPATQWLERKREPIGTHFFALWDKMATLAYPEADAESDDSADDSNLMFEALNRPGGILAWSLLDTLGESQPAKDSGLPENFRERLDKMIAANGRAGLLARVLLAERLNYLNFIDPDWAHRNLIPKLEWDHDEAKVLWQGYARSRIGAANVFNRLKPTMLEAIEKRKLGDNELENILASLVSVAIWHHSGEGAEFELSDAELRRLLTLGPPSLRNHVSWMLWRVMSDADDGTDDQPASPSNLWNDVVGPLFSAIWPLDASLRDERTSQNLVHMVLDCGDALPNAVARVSDYLIPYRLYEISHTLRLDEKHDALVAHYPLAFIQLTNVLIDPDAYPVPRDLRKLLDDGTAADQSVKLDDAYIRLDGLARQASA
ncbi:SIR2 family protein [Pseudochrobactrum algeriensis]|uniref:SIR2 family protein n=1 Tax=Pseudochrobactrum algeriensis TaxID=2834768 RepID=UPI001BD17356|nr:SIR2 family protein [Pseudochrobactrum algeriensis]QVQ36646.1 SIR2 family protein [Pseudochrobactrum algeriensis]QVQ39861.1 SIR2 family protein [Pseudochrobactrum algeriensis]QVQ43783.1 SIR2 family protein [Pseudochrobactrum algeriensis]